MIQIRMNNYIIRALLMHSIFSIVIKAENSIDDNVTAKHDLWELDRAKRSPDDELPNNLEAMIIDENGKYIHLQWEKVPQTLANEHLPIWTAHNKGAFTYHQSKPGFMDTLMPLTRYHDLDQTSAVMYIRSTDALWGAVDLSYSLNGIPLNLLHHCHKVGGPYVKKNEAPHPDETPIERPQPEKSVIDRFENCDERQPMPSTRGGRESRPKRNVVPGEMDLNLNNMTKIRGRRDENSEKYYVETLVIVTYEITQQYKTLYKSKYFNSLIRDQLLHFNFIDLLFAKLRRYDLNFYINVAGIIVEYEEGAFVAATSYPKTDFAATAKDNILSSIPRYLEYHDLPFSKDSVDLIYVSTSSSFLQQMITNTDVPAGKTYSRVDVYKVRQMYNDMFEVPVSVTTFDNFIQKSAIGAREIAYALQIDYESKTETSVENRCQIMMQKCAYCVNCLKWSSASVEQFREFTRNNKLRCFLLNFPRSLFPPGPRINLTPYQQCQCYGYQSHGKKASDGAKVSEQGCVQRLQCKNLVEVQSHDKPTEEKDLQELSLEESFDEPTILPLDGTPCGSDKVCWHENCVKV